MYLIPSASDSLRGGLSCWAASAVAQLGAPGSLTSRIPGQREELSSKILHLFCLGKPQANGLLPTDSRQELTGWSPLVPTVSPHQKALSSPTLPGKPQIQQLLWALRNTKGHSGDQADLSRGKFRRWEVEAAFHSLQYLSCSCYQGGSNRETGEGYSSSRHGLTSFGVGHHIYHPCGKCCAVL